MSQLVGDAYVRIHGDTRFLRDAIKRDAKRIGEEGGNSLLDSFSDTIRAAADRKLKGAQLELADAIAGGDFDRMLKRSGQSVSQFVSSMERDLKKFQEKGYFGNMAYDAKTAEKSLESLAEWAKKARAKELDEQAEMWRRAYEQQNADFRKFTEQRNRTMVQQERDWTRAIAAQNAEWRKINEDKAKALAQQERDWNAMYREQNAEFKRIIDERSRAWASYGKNLLASEKLAEKAEEATTGLTRATERNAIAARFGWSEWRRFNDERLRSLKIGEEDETAMRRWSRTIDRSVILLNRHSESTGRMFGAGSRSEFLNFIGRTVGLMSRLPNLVVAGFGKLVRFASDAVDQFSDLRKLGVPAMQAVGTIGARAFAAVVPFIISTVVGLGAMTQMMPALIMLFASLLGAITAVIGAVSIGLIGGLLALAPIAGGALVGIGLLAVGLSGLGDASDRVTKKMKPLVDAFKAFKEFAANDLANELVPIFGAIKQILQDIRPFVSDINKAFGDVLKSMVAVFQSPQMQPFLKVWGDTLPRILYDLGEGFGRLLAALTAFFTPILPYAERLADAFSVAMQRFLDWTTSAEGQNSIADFMQKAWEMGSKLWEVLKNVGSILGSILMSGAEGPGKDFLDWLAESTEKLAAFLKTPEGQEALRQFFEDVRDVMIEVKDLFISVKEKLEAVNWAQAQQDAENFISFVSGAVSAFLTFTNFISTAINTVRARWLLDITIMGDAIEGFILRSLMALDAIANGFIGWYNNTVGPVVSLFLHGIATMIRGWANFLLALGNVPGFEWATGAGKKMLAAAAGADEMADSIRKIPPSKLVNLYVEKKAAEANIASLKRALKLIPDEEVNVFIKTVQTAQRGVPYGVQVGNGSAGMGLPRMAFGGITRGSTLAGEDGAEAVLPLTKPLSLVSPEVRDITAYVRGQQPPQSGKTIIFEPGSIVVQSPSKDPELVARAFVDRLAEAASI